MYITFALNKEIPLTSISTIMVLIDDYVIDKMCKFHDNGVDIYILTLPGNENYIRGVVEKYTNKVFKYHEY
jgi:hypothetical protein